MKNYVREDYDGDIDDQVMKSDDNLEKIMSQGEEAILELENNVTKFSEVIVGHLSKINHNQELEKAAEAEAKKEAEAKATVTDPKNCSKKQMGYLAIGVTAVVSICVVAALAYAGVRAFRPEMAASVDGKFQDVCKQASTYIEGMPRWVSVKCKGAFTACSAYFDKPQVSVDAASQSR
jgi:hypothetical protein